MAQQLLRNPDIEPSNEIIANGLGTASTVYTRFLKDLKEYDVSLMDWRFYNDGKAWLSKGEHISQDAKSIIRSAKPMGKTMKYIPVIFDLSDEKQLNDIYVLMQFRKENI